jgi:hypothetical protein
LRFQGVQNHFQQRLFAQGLAIQVKHLRRQGLQTWKI